MGHAGHVPGRNLESASVLGRFRWKPLYRRGDRRADPEIQTEGRRGSVQIDRPAAGADALRCKQLTRAGQGSSRITKIWNYALMAGSVIAITVALIRA